MQMQVFGFYCAGCHLFPCKSAILSSFVKYIAPSCSLKNGLSHGIPYCFIRFMKRKGFLFWGLIGIRKYMLVYSGMRLLQSNSLYYPHHYGLFEQYELCNLFYV